MTTTGPAATSGAGNVRLPARFVIKARGSLDPASISAPAGVTIDLTVVSGDGRAHQVVLRARPPRPLAVPAGGRATVTLTGLPAGRHQVQVDGAAVGVLVVGAQPGP